MENESFFFHLFLLKKKTAPARHWVRPLRHSANMDISKDSMHKRRATGGNKKA